MQCHHLPLRQTKCLPQDIVSTFCTSLAVAYDNHHTTLNNPSPSPPDAADVWASFKEVIQDASGQLPSLPRSKEADWITDEVKNIAVLGLSLSCLL